MKRFQDCNKVIKMIRYIWYITIPFYFLYYYICGLKIHMDEELVDEELVDEELVDEELVDEEIVDEDIIFANYKKETKVKLMWSIAKSNAQYKMKYYYTTDEVFDNLKYRINKYK